ncbi:MAG: OmpA family protein, partial [Saprospiraceae bacterium]|nr:OmpA family protein [Saprospiraceae bacterium]
DTDNDVWFKFEAVASVVNISVIGAIRNNPGGTLQDPQFVLYRGSCKALYEIGCVSDGQEYNIVETFISNLVIGQTYYLRVDGRNKSTGSFQLCVNNYNPVPSPSSDCATAVVLCDKSSFTVPSMETAGKNMAELPRGTCLPEETQSAWYKWSCEKTGTLTIVLKPNNPSDDLDFMLFILPNGVTDCSKKIPVRCMAAGENLGAPFSNWKRCTGSTGLADGSSDIVEDQGCAEFSDNFLAPLRMEAGKSYALMVNNYQNTGNGFSVEFGGSGTLVGPLAHFTMSKLKVGVGEKLTIRDESTFAGGLQAWEWDFGVGAKPQRAKGAGPHAVTYSSAGKKSISLSVQSSNGCKVTKVRTVEVAATPDKAKPTPKKNEPKPEGPKLEKAPEKPEPKVPEPPIAEPDLAVSINEPDSIELLERPVPPALPTTLPILSENEGGPIMDEPNLPPLLQAPLPAAAIDTVKLEEPSLGTAGDTVWTTVTYEINYVATVYFKADSSALQPKDFETLDKVVEMMNDNPKYLANVEGHTNNIPSDDYATKLSLARANAAMDYLTAKGIDNQRLTRLALGKRRVLTKDNAHPSRRLNQRVEIKLMVRK